MVTWKSEKSQNVKSLVYDEYGIKIHKMTIPLRKLNNFVVPNIFYSDLTWVLVRVSKLYLAQLAKIDASKNNISINSNNNNSQQQEKK